MLNLPALKEELPGRLKLTVLKLVPDQRAQKIVKVNTVIKREANNALLFHRKLSVTPVNVRLRGQKRTEQLELILGKCEDSQILYVRKKTPESNATGEKAFVHFTEEGPYTRAGKSIYIKYINSEKGRKEYKGLDQILLRALAEHQLNKGKLPFIQGNALTGDFAAEGMPHSDVFHKMLGAERIGLLPGMVGIKSEKKL